MVDLLDTILATVPNVQLLVTSRIRLHLQQEHLYPVQGLDFPEWDTQPGAEAYGAVQLFVQRARRVQPGFDLTPAATPGVIQVVRLVAEQAVQQALAVFRGGFTREAAAQVNGATPRMLQAMIARSLLARSGDGGRYELHELLRQFAAEQLASDRQVNAQVRTRHAVYYLDWVADQAAGFVGPHGQTALRAVEQEWGNIQAAWDWAAGERDLALLHNAIPNVSAYYLQRSRNQEGYATCQRTVERLESALLSDDGRLVLAQTLAWQASFAIELAQGPQARRLLERSLPFLNTAIAQPVRAFVHYLLGRLSHLESDVQQARPWLESSLALYQAQGDMVGAARVLSTLGRLTGLAGDYGESYDWYTQALARYRTLADLLGSIQTISDLAMLSALLGRQEHAEHLFAEAVTMAQTLDDPLEMIKARRAIGMALANVGYNAAAAAQFESGLAVADHCESEYLRVENLVMLAFTHLMQCRYDQVTALGQQAFALANRAHHRRDAGFALMLLGLAELGRGIYRSAYELLHQCLSVYQVTNVADDQLFSLSGLSHAQRGLGDSKGARHTALMALHIAVQSRSNRAAGIALAAYVNVLLDEQQIERAVELEALVMNHPFAANSCFYRSPNTLPVAWHTECLPSEVVAAARARGLARTWLATLDEMWAESQWFEILTYIKQRLYAPQQHRELLSTML